MSITPIVPSPPRCIAAGGRWLVAVAARMPDSPCERSLCQALVD